MRQLTVQVPRGSGTRAADLARRHDAVNIARFEAAREDTEIDVVVLHLSNRRVAAFLEEAEAIDDLHVAFFPSDVLALRPPSDETPAQAADVSFRSPIEIYLAGIQSIGSWKGFLGYAAAAGAVVWIGLLLGIWYLLTAAMLIAPFAGPAMNTAIASASGDVRLLRRSIFRYGCALAVAIGVAAALSLVWGHDAASPMMIERSKISAASVVLPLVAGAAGALFLVQAGGSSLVSGASVGVLVAASLAPPAGVLGMSAAIGRWDLTHSVLFLLLLQLAGINLSGAVVFRLFGLAGRSTRYEAGQRWLFPASMAASLVLLGALLAWQQAQPIALERTSAAQHAAEEIQQVIRQSELARPIEIDSRFARPPGSERDVLLSEIYVFPTAPLPADSLRAQLRRRIRARLAVLYPDATPYVSLHIVEE